MTTASTTPIGMCFILGSSLKYAITKTQLLFLYQQTPQLGAKDVERVKSKMTKAIAFIAILATTSQAISTIQVSTNLTSLGSSGNTIKCQACDAGKFAMKVLQYEEFEDFPTEFRKQCTALAGGPND